ncbi:UNVERIFIED_CONTAM: hypothetical protein H355_000162 [Colinus virginianus]|nr:hypothetical protein H355_000162 [Colinus virginianus]
MDGGDGAADLVINKRFVSEAELEERRKRRQEEWEKVRKPEDPEECPEEAYDPRSLYERLQEQRERKQQEFEEQFKFSKHQRLSFPTKLNCSSCTQHLQVLPASLREEQRAEEYSETCPEGDSSLPVISVNGLLSLPSERIELRYVGEDSTEKSTLTKVGVGMDPKKETEKKLPMKSVENKNKFSQAKLLAGAVKHRSNAVVAYENETISFSHSSDGGNSVKRLKLDTDHEEKNQEKPSCVPLGSSSMGGSAVHCPSAAVCIGILPGLGAYSGSSDSESSSDGEGTINSTGKIVSSVFRSNSFFDGP